MLDYNDFIHIKVADFFKEKEKEYFVYLYFTYCPHCNAIKEEVLEFIQAHPNYKFYLINMDGDKDSQLFKDIENDDNLSRNVFIKQYVSDSIGESELKNVGYYYVPSLYEIYDHKIKNVFVTEIPIKGLLNELKK